MKTLSDFIIERETDGEKIIFDFRVKEFIRQLKEDFWDFGGSDPTCSKINEIINKRAGSKLIDSPQVSPTRGSKEPSGGDSKEVLVSSPADNSDLCEECEYRNKAKLLDEVFFNKKPSVNETCANCGYPKELHPRKKHNGAICKKYEEGE